METRTVDGAMVQSVDAAYGGVYRLLVDSEDYLSGGNNSRPLHGLTPHEWMLVISQEMRITARLGSVLAWLMMVRTIDAGEVEDVRRSLGRVDPFDTAQCCMDTAAHRDRRLPDRLRDLLKESHRVYLKVVEMDVTLCAAFSPGH
ncbi:MAG: DUF1465 family protein [Rhodospirillaceae bacterium]